jgi:hypothetical protein
MKDDDKFLANLEDSEPARMAIACLLMSKGVTVFAPPLKVRPSADKRKQFADGGDIFVSGLRVEVKHRKIQFRDRESFPHQTVFIDEQYKLDAKADSPLLWYVNLSLDMNFAAVVYGHHRDLWTLDSRWSNEEGRQVVNYEIDKRWVHFCPRKKLFG